MKMALTDGMVRIIEADAMQACHFRLSASRFPPHWISSSIFPDCVINPDEPWRSQKFWAVKTEKSS